MVLRELSKFKTLQPAQYFRLIGVGGETIDGFYFGALWNHMTKHFDLPCALLQHLTLRACCLIAGEPELLFLRCQDRPKGLFGERFEFTCEKSLRPEEKRKICHAKSRINATTK